MSLRVIIDDLKKEYDLSGDEYEEHRGVEYRETRPPHIEYLTTKRMICDKCHRDWVVVIYYEKGIEKLLHPAEAKCSYCFEKKGLTSLDIGATVDRKDPLYFLRLTLKGEELKKIMEKERAALIRLQKQPKCVSVLVGDSEVSFTYADGKVVNRPC